MVSLMAVWCPLYHVKMAAPSIVLEADVVVDSSGGSPRLMVDRIGVCNFVSKMGGVVRMFTTFFSVVKRVVCGVWSWLCLDFFEVEPG
jgi:hypothetical protein